MWPPDHVQMVTSWCELTLCVDRVGIRHAWEDSDTQDISIQPLHPQATMSAVTTAHDQFTVQLSIDMSTFYAWLSDNIQRQYSASFGFPRLLLTVARYDISLCIVHKVSCLWPLGFMNVVTRTWYKVSMKSLVAQPPSILFCYTHTIYDRTIIVLVLEQGYNHSPEVSYRV